MCGFCGMIGADASQNKEVIKKMMTRIIHRGPDQEGEYSDEEAVLGFRRLSIIDVDNGMQPLTNETEDIVIVFNGEIYNHEIIKEDLLKCGHVFKNRSDTEAILHGYEEYGERIVDRLEGMFAFVIWDKKKRKMFAARDCFGIKPFYYTLINNTFVFGSEIKSILEYPGCRRELNEEALEQYLSFQYSPLKETFFKEIFKLEPGTYLTYCLDDHLIDIKRYYDPLPEPDENAGREEYIKKIEDITQDSVKRHMLSDVEVGSFLSSGVDSSYIARSFGGAKTFTVGFLDRESKYNEISYAEELAEISDFENFSKVIDDDEYWDAISTVVYHLDEPLADASCIALYFVNKLARQHLKVCLSGEGADEFFGGYNIYHEPLSLAGYQKLPKGLRRILANLAKRIPDVKGKNFLIRGSKTLEERFIGNANIFSFEEREKILRAPKSKQTPQELLSVQYENAKNLDDISKMQYIDLKNWLPGDILLKADKMGMANSIEVRVPYLDKRVFEVAKKLPTELKVTDTNTKVTFRTVANKYLPQKTAEKKKLGFPTPIRVWLRQEKYYRIVKDAFQSETAAKYFHLKAINKLLDDHKKGKKDNSRKIWTIYIFLVWHRIYIEDFENSIKLA